jgi:hypothetical protein
MTPGNCGEALRGWGDTVRNEDERKAFRLLSLRRSLPRPLPGGDLRGLCGLLYVRPGREVPVILAARAGADLDASTGEPRQVVVVLQRNAAPPGVEAMECGA